MNTGKGIVLKLISAVLFAVMSALIRYLGARYPIGEVVFYRSAFAVVPVMLVYALRGELAAVVRTERPLGQAGRAVLSIVGMFCNFGALARLPLIESNAISFTSPLFSVALAALVLKERVRIYRWSAVIFGFVGVLVVLSPHLSGDELTDRHGKRDQHRRHRLWDRRLGCQCRDRDPDPPADAEQIDVLDRVLLLAELRARGIGDLAVRLAQPDRRRICRPRQHRLARRHRAYLPDRKLRYASASVVAPFDYTAMIWALVLGYAMLARRRRR